MSISMYAGIKLPVNPYSGTLGGAGTILLKTVQAGDIKYDPVTHSQFIGETLQGVADAHKLDVTFSHDDKMLKGTTLKELAKRLIDPGRRPLSTMAHRLSRHPAPYRLEGQQIFDIKVIGAFKDVGILSANAADRLIESATLYAELLEDCTLNVAERALAVFELWQNNKIAENHSETLPRILYSPLMAFYQMPWATIGDPLNMTEVTWDLLQARLQKDLWKAIALEGAGQFGTGITSIKPEEATSMREVGLIDETLRRSITAHKRKIVLAG